MSKQITVTIKRTQVTNIWVPDDFNMTAPYIDAELSDDAYEALQHGEWEDVIEEAYLFADVPLEECESDCAEHTGQVAWTAVGGYGHQVKAFMCLTARNADIAAGNQVMRQDDGADDE